MERVEIQTVTIFLPDVFYPKDSGMIYDDGYFHLLYKKTTKSMRNRYCNKTELSLKL